jgi:hypothetical protein
MRLGSLVLLVWLLIGLLAAGQRGYLSGDDEVDCARAGTVALTVVAGPLNYLGVNPEVDCDDVNLDVDVNLPEPSS